MKGRNNTRNTLTPCWNTGNVLEAPVRVNRVRGFSLIEVIVVVAIMGILSAIAYPSYQSYVLRSHRVTAQSEMQNIHTRQELYYVENRQYASLSELGYSADTVGLDRKGKIVLAGAGRFDLSMQEDPPAGQFVIRAAATAAQLADTACSAMTLNTTGDRKADGCW